VIRPDLTAPRSDSGDLEDAVDALFGRPAEEGLTYALVVQQGGETLVERYGTQPGNLFQPDPVEVGPDTPLVSWSVAKSIVHAAVGVLVADGRVDLSEPAPISEWQGTDKEPITLLDLLEMRSGLRFAEEYVDAEHSDCIAMLFGAGSDDHAAYAAALPLDHPIGMVWNYSSGSTNIVCRVLGDIVGGGEAASREQRMREFLDERLFGPVGMSSADPRFDPAGTWVGSSYVHATATDFARFGELYLRDGIVGGERILPKGWVAHARTRVADEPESGFGYGRHWWLWPDLPESLAAHGYDGQYVVVVPQQDAVIVHLGKTDAAVRPQLAEHLRRIIRCL
jgi:CubicO group peptidase (beta-lactamase class C family)